MKFSTHTISILLILLGSSITVFSQTATSKPEDKSADKSAVTENENKTKSDDVIVGMWDLDIEFQGQIYKAKLKVKKENAELKGDLSSDAGEGKIEKATFKENNFEAVIPFNFYGQPIQIKLKGTVEKDKMKGTLTTESQDMGDLPFTGMRAKE